MNFKFPLLFALLIFLVAMCLATHLPVSAAGSDNTGSKDTKGDEAAESCVATAKGPIEANQQQSKVGQIETQVLPSVSRARVGKPAPDFEANAFQNGKFRNIKLSDYKGRWVVLCFYPGDFTFV